MSGRSPFRSLIHSKQDVVQVQSLRATRGPQHPAFPANILAAYAAILQESHPVTRDTNLALAATPKGPERWAIGTQTASAT